MLLTERWCPSVPLGLGPEDIYIQPVVTIEYSVCKKNIESQHASTEGQGKVQ